MQVQGGMILLCRYELYYIQWNLYKDTTTTVNCPVCRGVLILQVYTFQCKGCQMGPSIGVLVKKVAAFERCPLIDVNFTEYILRYQFSE